MPGWLFSSDTLRAARHCLVAGACDVDFAALFIVVG